MALSGGGRLAAEDNVPVDQTFSNVAQSKIEITEDKLRNILYAYTDLLKGAALFLPVSGTLVTVILTLATSEPKDFLLPADTWRAVLIIAAVGVPIWFIYCAVRYIKFWRSPMYSIDGVVDVIKGIVQGRGGTDA